MTVLLNESDDIFTTCVFSTSELWATLLAIEDMIAGSAMKDDELIYLAANLAGAIAASYEDDKDLKELVWRNVFFEYRRIAFDEWRNLGHPSLDGRVKI